MSYALSSWTPGTNMGVAMKSLKTRSSKGLSHVSSPGGWDGPLGLVYSEANRVNSNEFSRLHLERLTKI